MARRSQGAPPQFVSRCVAAARSCELLGRGVLMKRQAGKKVRLIWFFAVRDERDQDGTGRERTGRQTLPFSARVSYLVALLACLPAA